MSNNWFTPPAAFMMPYMGTMGSPNSFYNEMLPGGGLAAFGDFGIGQGFGFDTVGANAAMGSQQFERTMMYPERHGSLTQTQKLELMNSLETEPFNDLDAYIKPENNADASWY